MTLRMLFLLCMSPLLPSLSHAFNVANSGATENIFVKGKLLNSFENNKRNESVFFGYKFVADTINTAMKNTVELVVSAPHQFILDYKSNLDKEEIISKEPAPHKRNALIPTNATGVIYVCETMQKNFLNQSGNRVHTCNQRAHVDRYLSSVDISDVDALGMSLGARNNSGVGSEIIERNQFVTCAPLRQGDCGSTIKAEGACYVSKTGPSRGDSQLATSWIKKTPCKQSCIQKDIDLMYVIDGSYSVGINNFLRVKTWIKDVTRGFDISDQVHVGVVQYSYYNVNYPNDKRYLKTEISLGQYKDFNQFAHAIDQINYHGYQTYTAHAIIKTVKDDFNGESSRYPDARRVMILLTDGKADDKKYLPNATHYAAMNEVESFAIGIGNYSFSELETIAGDEDRVLTVENFEGLGDIVSRLQNDIQVLEGASSPDEHNGLSHCQVGFSENFVQSGGLYLGAVGAWDWSGTIVKYDHADDPTPDIPDFSEVQKVLANWTKESYLGYALTSGFYNGESSGEHVAIGAPRYKLEGAVVIYRPRPNNANFTNANTIYPNPNNVQLGSYFGGTLLSMDLNNDQMDDLLVGAPLYIGSSYDDGRVYVYMSTPGGNNPQQWAESSYVPVAITGKAAGGRFGSAIAFAGDLNKDNYNDVIIGAPYAYETKGAVYVYHGSASGIVMEARQEILASSVSQELKYFGISLQAGQDLDQNDYPDIAVGAPKSDAVVIFRTRPVAKLQGSLTFSKSSINIFDCLLNPGMSCVVLTACLTVSGTNIEKLISVDYKLFLDTRVPLRDGKRLEFTNSQTESTIQGSMNFTRYIEKCWSYNITVKNSISNYSTPIDASFEFNLSPSHVNKPLSSIQDPNEKNTYGASTNFSRNCGDDGKCLYDLSVNGSVTLPAATLQINNKTEDLTDEGTRLIVSQQTEKSPIIVKVNMTNTGHNAFDVRLKLTFNRQLSWTNIWNTSSSNVLFNNPCMEDTKEDATEGEYKTKLFVYRYDRLLGSIMETNQWCYFQFQLSSRSLFESGVLANTNITVLALTQNGIPDDVEPSDNTWSATNSIRYRADVDATETGVETLVPFNFTNENQTINSVQEIGLGTADMQIRYKIDNRGYSNIPKSTIMLTYPFTMLEGDMYHLLYLYKYTCTPTTGSAECTCNTSSVNPYDLLPNYPTANDTNLPNVTVIANSERINTPRTYDCSGNAQANVHCQTFTCDVSNLGSTDSITFRASFRLWSQSLNLSENVLITLVSDFQYSTEKSTLLINQAGKNATTLKETVNTFARLYTKPIPTGDENNLWIYIVAAIGGLLLLILIIFILYKIGFFKSKYAEKKEALEWTEANPSGESGSSSDMMKK